MDGKKISFGFSKITKKPALQLNKAAKEDEKSKIELIKCLEGQEIKLVEEQKIAPPLVIPLKDGGKTSAALASLAKRRAVLLGEDDEPVVSKNSEMLTSNGSRNDETQNLDKRAEREILAELQEKTDTEKLEDIVLPVVKADELPLDGAKESNLDDYESVPIEKYGWAMLRGMGAVEPPKSEQKSLIDDGPMQRPAGLGLGADKALKPKPLLEQPEANEKLEIKKQAYVRILAGKHKDAYGQIEGFDHERGTIVVKLAIGGLKQKFQEFLCQPVAKKEYTQYSKCINKTKYEEYKKLENEQGQIIVKKEDDVKLKIEKSEREFKKHQAEMYESKHVNNLEKRLKYEDFPETSGSSRNNHYGRSRSRSRSDHRARSRSNYRTRSRSSSRSKKYSSKMLSEYDSFDKNYKSKARSESQSDSESSYERRKTKSHRNKSKNHKKKHKRRYNSSNDSSSNSSHSNDSDNRHKRDKKKKSKKKTKKSKRERSRTPTRRKR